MRMDFQRAKGSQASNARNDGRRFEELFRGVADQYQHHRLLRLEKCDAPTKVLGVRPNVKVIFQENPFADWVGSWTERGGRALVLETKSTLEDKLTLGGKLSDNQIEWLGRWHAAGAVTGVVWEANFLVGFLPLGRIMDVVKSGRRHIKFAEADPVPQGKGWVLFDFIQNLRRWYPEIFPAKSTTTLGV
jgi:penicillin-binding protein-related factor A (putative recombinase)